MKQIAILLAAAGFSLAASLPAMADDGQGCGNQGCGGQNWRDDDDDDNFFFKLMLFQCVSRGGLDHAPMMHPYMMGRRGGFGPQDGRGWRGMRGDSDRPRMMFDSSGDGTVSAEEAANAAERAFHLADRDGDGQIMTREVPDLGPDFAAIDADGNGSITKLEFLEARRKQFEGADANADGKVSVWEMRAARK